MLNNLMCITLLGQCNRHPCNGPAMPDLSTSLRLRNISSTFKGMPDASSLPVVVRFGCLAPPCAMPDRRSEFPIGAFFRYGGWARDQAGAAES